MIRSVLSRLGLIRKKLVSENAMLTVVTHIEPFVSLCPIRAELHLCADYYDSELSPENGAMFGKEYPGISLGWGLQALQDAREYAENAGYRKLVIERLLLPGITEPISVTTF